MTKKLREMTEKRKSGRMIELLEYIATCEPKNVMLLLGWVALIAYFLGGNARD